MSNAAKKPHEHPAWKDWIESRPQAIQDLSREYPAGYLYNLGGKLWWVVGYSEMEHGPGLIVSEIDPSLDYEEALRTRKYICPHCLKDSLK